MKKLGLSAAAVGIAVAASAAGTGTPAFAGHVKTFLIVTYNNTTPPNPIPVTASAPSVVVTVAIDHDTCLQAFNNKAFGVVASDDNASAVTVTPPSYSGLTCEDSARNFTLTGIATGGATIKFNIDAPPGLEGQTQGAQVNVSATGFGTDGGGNPPGHNRPAAPAVANGFLNTASQKSACQTAYHGDRNWHGEFIRDVAKWQAAHHLGKAKDDTAQYPLDTDWIAHVQAEVNILCS
jgi:hypothetical protein